ncbi:cysteine desulfuration protein SufE, putative [Plasmodium knowlesi strain H]|uniref:Cysteine desulfuration protein SufE, putative n=3 Tax=Plasmodium knowlesi TaxID=5850 RepID=A0A5K1VGT5_PLAKH|nr:cysteine desulfuration protein SufE, putative [Plasmodium knowlesi strain H]OTN66891.1 putative Cysteine desulfuration protein SufE [Plasmodium knowlesi]CAA9986788.1 cysteine desulfuration protein SufE, putative [Plasmodium knowlesi strain H]SBO23628.1 cysteine desulfuration protein SufE, putative [Plasmodium knowlesi strain H]SBO25202.1 cysteine desulfuration protein SufE, putative [Plasmodium knowlesi strain H]VVS76262.1 cysteine desulfuration protein SufE, putative [Plasmodium knowlesi s|eukprot:XP_002257972.1 SufE-like protein, putative [Plasmodium knowlesi strain H]
MKRREIKKIFFLYLQIIVFYSFMVSSMRRGKHHSPKKSEFKIIKRLSLFDKKKINRLKCNSLLYLKNCNLRNCKSRNSYLRDMLEHMSGGQPLRNSNIEQYQLTPKLKKTVQFFQELPNDPYRKSQEVILLGRKCPPMPEELKNRQNQVLGCQSTVYVYPTVETHEGKKIITWLGDSDGLLTKGIVYILVDGLSGYPPEEILRVNPNFITLTGISEFLTMSRINGYLNIMNKMKAFSTSIMQNGEH